MKDILKQRWDEVMEIKTSSQQSEHNFIKIFLELLYHRTINIIWQFVSGIGYLIYEVVVSLFTSYF